MRQAVVAVLIVSVGWVLIVLSLQRRILFPCDGLRTLPAEPNVVEGTERLWLSTDQGRVEAWFRTGEGVGPERPGPLVVFAHGNGEVIDDWPGLLVPYRLLGVSVLMPEYRGYGRSAGSPSQDAIVADFVRLVRQATRRPEVDATRVIYHGRSLGGGVLCEVARQVPPAALVLQSAFRSVRALSSRFLVPGFMVLDPFDAEAALRELDLPVLLLHGEHDDLVPFEHAQALQRAAPRARLVAYPCGHNNFPLHSKRYWEDVAAFLKEADVVEPSAVLW